MNEQTLIVNACLKKTILIILTSFHSYFSTICLRLLEQSVDIPAFKRVYILANCTTQEHTTKLKQYEHRYTNLQCIFYEPKGLQIVTAVLETVLNMHRNDIILKIDDDVFVTKNCINNLINAYYKTLGNDSISLLTPLVWNNGACLDTMKQFLINKYPHAADKDVLNPAKGLSTSDEEGCDFLWNCELSDNVMTTYSSKEKERIHYTNHYLSINCIVFDSRIMDKALPFRGIDEKSFNEATISHKMYFAIDTSALAYHYSFGPLKNFMLTKYPAKRIENHILSL